MVPVTVRRRRPLFMTGLFQPGVVCQVELVYSSSAGSVCVQPSLPLSLSVFPVCPCPCPCVFCGRALACILSLVVVVAALVSDVGMQSSLGRIRISPSIRKVRQGQFKIRGDPLRFSY